MAYGNSPPVRPTYSTDRGYNRHAPYVPTAPAPEPPKAPIDLSAIPRVAFKDNYYGVALLRLQAGPKIEIKRGEMHETVLAQVRVADLPLTELYEHEPVIAKYEGKYVVLLGHKKAQEQLTNTGKLIGKLLSNPTLKRAKLG